MRNAIKDILQGNVIVLFVDAAVFSLKILVISEICDVLVFTPNPLQRFSFVEVVNVVGLVLLLFCCCCCCFLKSLLSLVHALFVCNKRMAINGPGIKTVLHYGLLSTSPIRAHCWINHFYIPVDVLFLDLGGPYLSLAS